MTQAKTEGEIELLALNLKRDEQARRALGVSPRGWRYKLSLGVIYLAAWWLASLWQGLPAYAGIVLAFLCAAVCAMGLELNHSHRRISAMVRLLRLPTEP